jgi:hypothetical protein
MQRLPLSFTGRIERAVRICHRGIEPTVRRPVRSPRAVLHVVENVAAAIAIAIA